MPDVRVDISNVNWKGLRKQKLSLLKMAGKSKQDGALRISKHLQGILHLLDHIQDEAAEVLGDKAVFGENLSG